MERQAGNRLSLLELEQIEDVAHHTSKCDSALVLRLAAALREALQEKENACALAVIYKEKAARATSKNETGGPRQPRISVGSPKV